MWPGARFASRVKHSSYLLAGAGAGQRPSRSVADGDRQSQVVVRNKPDITGG